MYTFFKIKEQIIKMLYKKEIFIGLILCIIVFLCLPMLRINHVYPFKSFLARIFVLGLFVIVALLLKLIQYLQKIQSFSELYLKLKYNVENAKQYTYYFFMFYKTKLRRFKISMKKDKMQNFLQKSPWYLVLGSHQSGKKTLIHKLGLYYSKSYHFGKDAKYCENIFPDYDWWFSQQAILINIMSTIKDENNTTWKRFLKLLKRLRKNKPFNGIILIFPIKSLLRTQKRQEFLQDCSQYIRDIHENFKVQVPLYFILTQVDQVEGFCEFFHDMSKDELDKVWGLSIPLSKCDSMDAVIDHFRNEYSYLIELLRNQFLWIMNAERNEQNRALIFNFPQQMQLYSKILENFIVELFSAIRYPKALQFRGIYFTSCKQEGETYDFLLNVMAQKFQLIDQKHNIRQVKENCYFVPQLFHQVILPEAPLLGLSERSKRIHKFTYNTLRIATPLIVLFLIFKMHEGYVDNLYFLKHVDDKVNQFKSLQSSLNINNDSLMQFLPSIDQLQKAEEIYQNNVSMSMKMLWITYMIKHHIHETLMRLLQNEFMPRVAAQIENMLNQNISNQDLLYATLKGYLAFSPNDSTRPEAIKAPMEYMWNLKFREQPKVIQSLHHYLKLALTMHLKKLPVDLVLIKRIRGELETIIPSDRAYGLLQLKSTVGELPPLYLNSAVGGYFNDVFIYNDTISIPALYTQIGFKKIFLSQYQMIAEEVAQDNQDIGLSRDSYETQTQKQIEEIMEENYQQNYKSHWFGALNNLNIINFNTLPQAIALLQKINSRASPIVKLFHVIYDNTNGVKLNKIHVDQAFERMNQYTEGAIWQSANKNLQALQDYLTEINNSTHPDKSAYSAVLSTIQTGKSPIIELKAQAQRAPKPIKFWLLEIANHSWNTLIISAHNYLNEIWYRDVWQDYSTLLQNRYPIDSKGNAQISIDNFNHFFNKNGTLATFFNNYIKAFVNTDTPIWKLYSGSGYNLGLSPSQIEIFQRMYQIQKKYFSDSNQSHFSFTISPLTLDAHASGVNLIIGSQKLVYRHGPQHALTINWPLANDNQSSIILLTDFSGLQFRKEKIGPWSLFQLFDQGEMYEEQSGTFIYKISFQNINASFTINGSSDLDFYRLNLLKNFTLPKNIF